MESEPARYLHFKGHLSFLEHELLLLDKELQKASAEVETCKRAMIECDKVRQGAREYRDKGQGIVQIDSVSQATEATRRCRRLQRLSEPGRGRRGIMKAGKPGPMLLSVALCALIPILVIKLAITITGAFYFQPETTISVPDAMAKDDKPKVRKPGAGRKSGQKQVRPFDSASP